MKLGTTSASVFQRTGPIGYLTSCSPSSKISFYDICIAPHLLFLHSPDFCPLTPEFCPPIPLTMRHQPFTISPVVVQATHGPRKGLNPPAQQKQQPSFCPTNADDGRDERKVRVCAAPSLY